MDFGLKYFINALYLQRYLTQKFLSWLRTCYEIRDTKFVFLPQEFIMLLFKYVSKIYALNFEIVVVTRSCIRFFSCLIAFQSSDRAELDF